MCAHPPHSALWAPCCADLGGVSTSSDIFGFAVILWELVTREHPWEGLPSTAIIYRCVSTQATDS